MICEGVIDGLSCIELGIGYPIGVAGVNSKAIFDPQVINNLGKFDVIVAGDNDIAGQNFNLNLQKNLTGFMKLCQKQYRWVTQKT